MKEGKTSFIFRPEELVENENTILNLGVNGKHKLMIIIITIVIIIWNKRKWFFSTKDNLKKKFISFTLFILYLNLIFILQWVTTKKKQKHDTNQYNWNNLI